MIAYELRDFHYERIQTDEGLVWMLVPDTATAAGAPIAMCPDHRMEFVIMTGDRKRDCPRCLYDDAIATQTDEMRAHFDAMEAEIDAALRRPDTAIRELRMRTELYRARPGHRADGWLPGWWQRLVTLVNRLMAGIVGDFLLWTFAVCGIWAICWMEGGQ